MSTGTRKTAGASRTKVRKVSKRGKVQAPVEGAVLTEQEMYKLGEGQISYIRTVSAASARKMFPGVKGLPKNCNLFALFSADGTALALTDSHKATVGHATEGELEVCPLH